MKGQASVEIILIVAIAILFSFLVLGKYLQLHESIFRDAAVREQVIYSISQQPQSEYVFSGIGSADCGTQLRYNVTLTPLPSVDEQTALTAKIMTAVRGYSNNPAKTISVTYNLPQSLAC